MAFSYLDKILGLMGNLDKPLPPFYSGLDMVKSILPNILSSPKWIILLKRYGDMRSSEFAAIHFEKDSKLFTLFKGFSYPDMPAMMVGPSLSGVFEDVWAVKGGMQSWADILAENFRKLGGDLKLNSYVDKNSLTYLFDL